MNDVDRKQEQPNTPSILICDYANVALTPIQMIERRPSPIKSRWCARGLVDFAEMLAADLEHSDSLRTSRHGLDITSCVRDSLGDLARTCHRTDLRIAAARNRGDVAGDESYFRTSSIALRYASGELEKLEEILDNAYIHISYMTDRLAGDCRPTRD